MWQEKKKELLASLIFWAELSFIIAYLATSESNVSDTSQSIMVQPLVDETTETESSDIPSN